jgi:hypothetical protein
MPDKPNPAYQVDNFSELGASGLWRTGGFVIDDILPQLRGKQAQTAYRDMSENDPIIGAVLFAIERVILQVDWRIDPYDDTTGATPTPEDSEAAEFVTQCMNDMSHSWHELMIAILSFLPYGWSFFEIVYKQRKGPDQKDPAKRSKYSDNKVGWRKIVMRSQDSLWQWQFDESGGIKAMIQRDPTTGRLNVIPIEKGLLFRTTSARGNPEGRSVLRNAFKSWYYKRRIEEFEAVGVERDLAGLPVGYVPPEWMSANATPAERAALNAMERIVRGVKRNETEGVILPSIYDESGKPLVDFKLLNSGGTRQFNTDKIIERYNQHIAMTVLADFIMLGHESVGSFALGTSKVDLFVAAVESWIRLIAEIFNTHAIPRLMSMNGYDSARLPKLTYGQVSAIDLQELGAFLLNLSQSQLITPDNNLEEYLRELAGLPSFRPEPDGVADNQRYGDGMMTADETAQMEAGQGSTEASPQDNTESEEVQNPQGGLSDLSGGSGLQADITSSGYTGEAPPTSQMSGAKGGVRTGGQIKRPPSGMSGPLTNNQRSTS